jgi:hypothetical protein
MSGLLRQFDVVFAWSFTAFMPPPYDLAGEVRDKISMEIDAAAERIYLAKRLGKRKHQRRAK